MNAIKYLLKSDYRLDYSSFKNQWGLSKSSKLSTKEKTKWKLHLKTNARKSIKFFKKGVSKSLKP